MGSTIAPFSESAYHYYSYGLLSLVGRLSVCVLVEDTSETNDEASLFQIYGSRISILIYIILSRIMRKPDFAYAKSKSQISCAVYTDSTIPPLLKSEVIFCICTGRFVSDLVGNPEDRLSRVAAHIVRV